MEKMPFLGWSACRRSGLSKLLLGAPADDQGDASCICSIFARRDGSAIDTATNGSTADANDGSTADAAATEHFAVHVRRCVRSRLC